MNFDSLKAGADIHSGDGGYSIGTQEKYDEFVRMRNESNVYWTIVFIGEYGQYTRETWTPEQILKAHYTKWYGDMVQAGQHNNMSTARCIENWVVAHNAVKTNLYGELLDSSR